jgi:hypothetical protein
VLKGVVVKSGPVEATAEVLSAVTVTAVPWGVEL